MKGSIRFILGLMLCMGAVGGMENNESLLATTAIAIIGLATMYSGARNFEQNV